jgi:hypothetical protein
LKPIHDSKLLSTAGFTILKQDRPGRVGGGSCVHVRDYFKCVLYKFKGVRSLEMFTEFIWIEAVVSN